jgi:hypothetical protein
VDLDAHIIHALLLLGIGNDGDMGSRYAAQPGLAQGGLGGQAGHLVAPSLAPRKDPFRRDSL